jgi:MAF protein
MFRLILASNSPRRRELLSLLGLPFASTSVEVDETPAQNEAPTACVKRLSQDKARQALREIPADASTLVLTSDTIVALAGEIFGKPADSADARRMLTQLRGRDHSVLTAVTLAFPDGRTITDLCETSVPMRGYTDSEMETYIASGDPLDKAGAYAIQHAGFHPVESLSGCYASVMGLPLCHVARCLQRAGITSQPGLPARCQEKLHYQCPVHSAILSATPEYQETLL